MPMFEDLRQDLRYATRTLTRERTFAAAAVLMLALGIGANSAMFALVDAILLRPLPFPAPDRLVMLWEQTPASPRTRVSPINLLDWKARSRTFEGMAAYVPNIAGMVLASEDGNAETVSRQWVSSAVFDVLGVRPVAGRTFLPSDDTERASVVVLTESFWRSRFNADPTVVGRSLRLDGDPWTVVGIVPDAAQVIGRASMWALSTPRFPPVAPSNANRAAYAGAIGRLKPGVTHEAAAGDLSAIAAALARELPGVEHRTRRHDRAAARGRGRPRASRDIDPVPGCRRPRAADLLREHRQPSSGARDGTAARVGDEGGARRRTVTRRATAVDRKPRPRRGGWIARRRSRSGHPERGAVGHPAGPAAGAGHPVLRSARARLLRAGDADRGRTVRPGARVAGSQCAAGTGDRLRESNGIARAAAGRAPRSPPLKWPPPWSCSLPRGSCSGRSRT